MSCLNSRSFPSETCHIWTVVLWLQTTGEQRQRRLIDVDQTSVLTGSWLIQPILLKSGQLSQHDGSRYFIFFPCVSRQSEVVDPARIPTKLCQWNSFVPFWGCFACVGIYYTQLCAIIVYVHMLSWYTHSDGLSRYLCSRYKRASLSGSTVIWIGELKHHNVIIWLYMTLAIVERLESWFHCSRDLSSTW